MALCFIGLAAVVFIWLCGWGAVIWAGFNGFGDPPMEYTAEGEKATTFLLYLPVLPLLFLILFRVGRNIKRKEPASRYIKDLFLFIAAVGVGILFLCFVPEPRTTIVDTFKHLIRQAGWLEYPIP